ncbi:MAG: hypothetical protein ACON4U_13390 [Myxococcota bacterium]
MSALPSTISQLFNDQTKPLAQQAPEYSLQLLDGGSSPSRNMDHRKSYDPEPWTYLNTDSACEFAIFESDACGCIALVNLRTGEWFYDDDPNAPVLTFEEDDRGEYILDHRDMSKLYLSRTA